MSAGESQAKICNEYFFPDRPEETQEEMKKQDDNMPPVADILMGDDYCIALCEDGSVRSWGNNESGKLGVAAGTAEVPQTVALPNKIIRIMDGGISIWALSDNGDVYVWGKIRVSTGRKGEKSNRLFNHDIALPMKVKDIPPLKGLSVRNERLVALGYDGTPYMWGVTPEYSNWYSDKEAVYVEEKSDFRLPDGAAVCMDLERLSAKCGGDMAVQVQCAEVGAGCNHYFIREDGTVFSVMRREGYVEGAYGFLFPNGNQEAEEITYYWPEELENIRMVEEPHGFGRAVVYYECENITDAERISADDYTMFLQKKDETLYYWMSDRVTYHDFLNAQCHAEDGLEHGEGYFVPVEVASVLGVGEGGAVPRIVAMCSNEEHTLFLTDDGRLFVSSYVTDRVEGVPYYNRQNGAIGRIPSVQICENVPLKRVGFEKLDHQDIVSINCDGKDNFTAVDSAGNFYRINMLKEEKK